MESQSKNARTDSSGKLNELSSEVDERKVCVVCYDTNIEELDFCIGCNVVCCGKCASLSLESAILSMHLGSIKPLFCPFCHTRIVNYSLVCSLISRKAVDYQNKLINSIMHFLCGGCHSSRNLSIEWSEEQQKAADSYLTASFSTGMDDFRNDLDKYTSGLYSVDVFYDKLSNFVPPLKTVDGASTSIWQVFVHVLGLIRDPERRCALHLRYLKLRPRFLTTCCHREHCFNCKTRDFHHGKTCEENSNLLEHSIIPCPGCQIPITRGDGCNSITCVCGRNWAFAHEKEMLELSLQFSAKYSSEAVPNCVRILTTTSDKEEHQRELRQARAFQYKNLVAVNAGLIKWFRQRFAPYPSHMVCKVSFEGFSEGAREAASLWRLKEAKEVSKCHEEVKKSIQSIFLSFFPGRKDQAAGARSILDSTSPRKDVSPELIKSAKVWLLEHEAEYSEEKQNYEKRQSDRFLFLFGSLLCSKTKPVSSRFAYSTEFDVEISNKALTFSGDAMSAQRKGSVSCYPAAFAKLSGVRSMITLVLTEAPFRTNWLTVGLVTRSFTDNSTDGVGKTPLSWGISDDRSHNTSLTSPAKICSCGIDLGTCPKFSKGDKIQMFFESAEGWLEIFVNHDLVHKFKGIPPCTELNYYYFCLTFATDHMVTVIPEGNYFSEPIRDELNVDHSSMYASFKRRMSKLYYDNNPSLAEKKELQTTAECVLRSTDEHGIASIHNNRFLIEELITYNQVDSKNVGAANPPLTWRYVHDSACYLRSKALEQKARKAECQSLLFISKFGDDRNFVAAALFHQQQKSLHKTRDERLVSKQVDDDYEENLDLATSYLEVYPTELNAWYEYSDGLSDPLFTFDPKCRCLPRHLPGKCIK